jgi:hypothetical protein
LEEKEDACNAVGEIAENTQWECGYFLMLKVFRFMCNLLSCSFIQIVIFALHGWNNQWSFQISKSE